MKALIQNLRNGDTSLEDVPVPAIGKYDVLVRTELSLISLGTERMLVEFGKANIFQKARQQPEKVAQVLDKVSTDGFLETFDAVKTKLDSAIPLGYCNTGIVVDVGSAITDIRIGDRVVSNGSHSEFVSVPVNLCAKVDRTVRKEQAVFAILGSIALQGVRVADCRLGDTVVVVGLGLIGLLSIELLRAAGCQVIGIDPDQSRREIAVSRGVANCYAHVEEAQKSGFAELNAGNGADSVLVTAASTSKRLLSNSAKLLRRKGSLVLVGVCPIELDRDTFFKKEIFFQVSSSYGPGRYDVQYENKGFDYPIGYVRWTANRNIRAFLQLLQDNSVETSHLITKTVPFEKSLDEYSHFGHESSLGVLLDYRSETDCSRTVSFPIKTEPGIAESLGRSHSRVSTSIGVSVIGAGNYVTKIIAPSLSRRTILKTLVSKNGLNASLAAKRFGFKEASSDPEIAINDPEVELIFIATPHESHCDLICRSLDKGKKVFVEKPLCISSRQLERLKSYSVDSFVMVGFNRRYSKFTRKIKQLLASEVAPSAFIYTVNAGVVDSDHWVMDMRIGGGRIIGEVCHFVDLLQFLSGGLVESINVSSLSGSESTLINLTMTNGSVAQLNYLTNGNKKLAKERLEVFCAGKHLLLDNFKSLKGRGWSNFSTLKSLRQDKGQRLCIESCVKAAEEGKPCPISLSESIRVTEVCFEIVRQCRGLTT